MVRKCIWITGLPGSGKSTVAREFCEMGRSAGVPIYHLEMDAIRKLFFPEPKYTDDERGKAYAILAFMAEFLVKSGIDVAVDATAHRREYRDSARGCIEGFVEVFIEASIETCMEREGRRNDTRIVVEMYEKALERKRTGRKFPGLGEVIGVDVQYESSPDTELSISSETYDPSEIACRIWNYLIGDVK